MVILNGLKQDNKKPQGLSPCGFSVYFLHIPSSFFFNTINDSTADKACAISVAQAAPATPSFKLLTKYISSPIFTKDENIRMAGLDLAKGT